jgi:enoyl-CoA hydratase
MASLENQLNENGILTIRLNRPDKLNALNDETLQGLAEILTDAKDNPEIKALLIIGTDKAFCAGADIKQLALCNAQTGYEFACRGQEIFRQLETLGKPSLAAVNGFAFGGGCELAMAATLRIASANAQFGQPEVKLGVIPGYGGTQRLVRLVGKGRALDLCLTGRFIDAETALAWGLVTEVVEGDKLLDRAEQILSQIISMAPLAIAAAMEVIDRGLEMTLPDALLFEANRFGWLCASLDKKEGVSAFLEKRKASFQGA